MEPIRSQMLYYLGAFLALPFFPLLLWQGRRVRASVPELPEAGGPRSGTTGNGALPLRLLVMGESTVAGVGVANHQEGLAGQLAQLLYGTVQRPVQWQVLARSGYTARRVRQQLVPSLPDDPVDIIIIGLGGNDTFTLKPPLSWYKEMVRLLKAIRKKQPGSQIVIMSLPPVGDFPAFPASLQLLLGQLVHLHARAIRNLPDLFEKVHFISTPVSFESWKERIPDGLEAEAFFSDGVHPSALTYQLWAEEAVEFMRKQGIIGPSRG